ncbi:MAG: hypothetical protein R3B82_16885 [Sandaracinaceae bacterium]
MLPDRRGRATPILGSASLETVRGRVSVRARRNASSSISSSSVASAAGGISISALRMGGETPWISSSLISQLGASSGCSGGVSSSAISSEGSSREPDAGREGRS